MNLRGRGRGRGCGRGRPRLSARLPFSFGLTRIQPRTMSPGPSRIARSPTPPETDDDGEEWPVHGIVGEDVDVFGVSR